MPLLRVERERAYMVVKNNTHRFKDKINLDSHSRE